MDRVVVILGVGRVDGDERQVAPVLVMGALPKRVDFFRLRQRLGPEQIGDVMGAQRDQADRLTQDYLTSLRKDAAIEIKMDSLKPQGPAPSP